MSGRAMISMDRVIANGHLYHLVEGTLGLGLCPHRRSNLDYTWDVQTPEMLILPLLKFKFGQTHSKTCCTLLYFVWNQGGKL